MTGCTSRRAALATILCVFGSSRAGLADQITVLGAPQWQNSGLTLIENAQYQVTGSGWVASDGALQPNSYHNPDGIDKDGVGPFPNAPGDFLAPGLVRWSLVGRIDTETPFQLGSSILLTAPSSGDLQLAFNDNFYADNSGSYDVTLAQIPEPGTTCLMGLGCLVVAGWWVSRRFR